MIACSCHNCVCRSFKCSSGATASKRYGSASEFEEPSYVRYKSARSRRACDVRRVDGVAPRLRGVSEAR